eukprot:5657486-Amphidinium_carterae.3
MLVFRELHLQRGFFLRFPRNKKPGKYFQCHLRVQLLRKVSCNEARAGKSLGSSENLTRV